MKQLSGLQQSRPVAGQSFSGRLMVALLAALVAGSVIAIAYILVGHGYYGMMLAVAYAVLFFPIFFMLSVVFRERNKVLFSLLVGAAMPALLVASVYIFGESDTEVSVILLFGVAGLLGSLVQRAFYRSD